MSGSEKWMGNIGTRQPRRPEIHAPCGPSVLHAYSPAHTAVAESVLSTSQAFFCAASNNNVEANWQGALMWSQDGNVVDYIPLFVLFL